MMEISKITLSSGATHLVKHTPEEIYQRISHSDGKPKNHIHLFTLENGDEIYINATYISSIEKVSSHISSKVYTSHKEDKQDSVEEENRIKGNLEAVKEFKEDLDGNME